MLAYPTYDYTVFTFSIVTLSAKTDHLWDDLVFFSMCENLQAVQIFFAISTNRSLDHSLTKPDGIMLALSVKGHGLEKAVYGKPYYG